MREMALLLTSIDQVDFEDFVDAFNRAYADYYVNISLSADAFWNIIERDDVSLTRSVVAVDETGRILGMGLLGLRPPLAWIGGLGVLPAWRRRGLGRRMVRRLLTQARQAGMERVQLEVISHNWPARALYEQLGFAYGRRLGVLRRPAGPLPPGSETGGAVRLCPPAALLADFDFFHQAPPSWQSGRHSLESLAPLMHGWAIFEEGAMMGYLLGHCDEDCINLLDAGVAPGADAGRVLGGLLAHLHRLYPQAAGAMFNLALDHPAYPAFAALGYRVGLEQFEMSLALV